MYYEIPQPPPPENIGKDIWRVVRLQLGIFIAYQVLLALLCQYGGMNGFIFIDMLPLVLHWLVLIILMIISFANSRRGAGFGYLISLGITAIIGFGSCFYLGQIVDGHFNI
jgi:hypothetical protein